MIKTLLRYGGSVANLLKLFGNRVFCVLSDWDEDHDNGDQGGHPSNKRSGRTASTVWPGKVVLLETT
jgi:hypothetical protein